MKFKLKIISTILLITSVLFTNVYATTPQNFIEDEYTTSAVPISTIRTVLKYAFKISDYLYSGSTTNRYPQNYVEGADMDSFTTGAINFNDKMSSGFGSTATKEILATQSGQKVSMMGINQQTFVGKMAFQVWKNGSLIGNPSSKNPYEIYDKSLSSGTHQLAYIVTAKETWSGYTAFYHYAAGNNTPTVIGEELSSISSSIDGMSSNINFNAITNSDNIEIKEKGNYIAIKRKNVSNDMLNKNRSYITFNDLRNEFYDAQSNMFVHQSINYNIGDEIIVSDRIADLVYDSDSNETSLFFKVEDTTMESISFKGDLTKRFKAGKEIKLKFKILPMFDDSNEYQIIDHNFYHQSNDVAPLIDDFLYTK